mgnify:CR=1 FL=1
MAALQASAGQPGDLKDAAMEGLAGNEKIPVELKTALKQVLISTKDVPLTDGYKRSLRHEGHNLNVTEGALVVFATFNFADTYSPVLFRLVQEGLYPGSAAPPALEIKCTLTDDAPDLPSLQQMHQLIAESPRAQAKFFLLMSELHYRFIIGVERLHIGRTTLARPRRPVHDDVASSLQPCIAPGTTDVQAPLEAQGRGFTHGHGKGHAVVGPTIKWLRKAVTSGLMPEVQNLRQALLDTAVTVQYDAAREPARQLGVDLRPEPFTRRQQRQSRMDGGVEDNGTQREYV